MLQRIYEKDPMETWDEKVIIKCIFFTCILNVYVEQKKIAEKRKDFLIKIFSFIWFENGFLFL